MSTIAWCWLAAFGGFLMGWFLCLVLTRPDREDKQLDQIEAMWRR